MDQSGRYPNRMADVKPHAATVPAGYAIQWEKRLEPKKFDFAEGSCLVGVMLDVERRTVRDTKTGAQKPVVRYTVRELEDVATLTYNPQPYFFFGTYQLDSMLGPRDVGHFVSITCKGEDKAAGRNGNAMKLFDVVVDKNMAPGFANDGTAITDDDLPPMDVYNA